MLGFLDSFLNNRPGKTDLENGEYYLGLLTDKLNEKMTSQNKQFETYQVVDLIYKNSVVKPTNVTETLGFYCRITDFDSDIIEEAFDNVVNEMGTKLTQEKINFYLTGASIPSQISTKAEETLNAGLETGKKVAGTVADTAGSLIMAPIEATKAGFGALKELAVGAPKGILNLLNNLPSIIFGLIAVAILYYLLKLVGVFKKSGGENA